MQGSGTFCVESTIIFAVPKTGKFTDQDTFRIDVAKLINHIHRDGKYQFRALDLIRCDQKEAASSHSGTRASL